MAQHARACLPRCCCPTPLRWPAAVLPLSAVLHALPSCPPHSNPPFRDQKGRKALYCACQSPTQQPRRVSTGATRSSSVGMGAPSPQGSGASSLPQDLEPDHREHLLRPSVTPVPPAVSQSARARASRLPPCQNSVEARMALNALTTSRFKAYAGSSTHTPARTHAHIHAHTHTPTPHPHPQVHTYPHPHMHIHTHTHNRSESLPIHSPSSACHRRSRKLSPYGS